MFRHERDLRDMLEEMLAMQRRILQSVKNLEAKETIMSKEMDDLTAQVASNSTVLQSMTTFMQGIAAQLAAAGTDPAKLAALAATLKDADTQAEAALAVLQSTPAAPVDPAAAPTT